MKRGFIWVLLTCLMVASLVLASCSTKTTATTQTQTTTSSQTTMTTKTSTTTQVSSITTLTTTTTSGNWWDSLGTPQYGGTMTLRLNRNIVSWDPEDPGGFMTFWYPYMELLVAPNWALDQTPFKYFGGYTPSNYLSGHLAESWEFTDPGTYVIHLHQGIHWQDIPPVNGREFIADDVVWHFDRAFGLGSGLTPPSYNLNVYGWPSLISITATDKYTVVYKWKVSNPEFILEAVDSISGFDYMENREAVQQWGDVRDWHHAIGTGPFILKDFVSDSSATAVRNPNYWGYDQRYPQNKLPYVDKISYLIIPDNSTALSAVRTGKIDAIDGIPLQSAQSMQKSNPEILQIAVPMVQALTLDPRNDLKPFNDIRVREAMQEAIDLPTIASTYYGGTCSPYPSSLTSDYLSGWGFPYDKWPQDLKDQYAYNPTVAKQLLAAAGYPNGFNTNVVADVAGDINLLQIVKSYLAAVGINMEIRTMESASFIAFVQTNKKQDQLAYRVAGKTGLESEPIRQLTLDRTGAPQNFDMINDPIYNAFYPAAMAATSIDEVKKVVRDANEYFMRQFFIISLPQPNLFALYQPWLKGYAAQFGSISSGAASGPQYLFLFGARFWIDQNLKRSMQY